MKEALSYDDVLLVPQYSEIRSRSLIDLSSGRFKLPIGNAVQKLKLQFLISTNKYKTKSGKKVHIADMVKGGRYAWKTIAEEIQKCRILCMNCHMEVTHLRPDLNPSISS